MDHDTEAEVAWPRACDADAAQRATHRGTSRKTVRRIHSVFCRAKSNAHGTLTDRLQFEFAKAPLVIVVSDPAFVIGGIPFIQEFDVQGGEARIKFGQAAVKNCQDRDCREISRPNTEALDISRRGSRPQRSRMNT